MTHLHPTSTSTDIALHTRAQLARDLLPELAPPDEPLAAHGFREIVGAIRWLIAACAVCAVVALAVWVAG